MAHKGGILESSRVLVSEECEMLTNKLLAMVDQMKKDVKMSK